MHTFLKKLHHEKKRVRIFLTAGIVFSLIYACLEYIARLNSESPQDFIPLVLRAIFTAVLIMVSVVIFEINMKHRFTQKRFLHLVIVRSCYYTAVVTIWLATVNAIWYAINGHHLTGLKGRMIDYFVNDTYLINLSFIFVFALAAITIFQVNGLHRKGELLNFILGRYHSPREVERIFCFIDLINSTAVAEKLGHIRFANFLKDYYSDITGALVTSQAQIYQYVGDEIVLSWSFRRGLQQYNAIYCFFRMQEIITEKQNKYLEKYNVYPTFKAGIHGGKVIVTWIGELKKEIVYIGDVLNTTARIQEDCTRLSKDYLISENLLNKFQPIPDVTATFIEETAPRGKKNPVKLYSLEKRL